MLAAILGALNPISAIADAIAKERIAAHNATTDKERIESDERRKTLELRRDVLLAEAGGSKVNAWVRALLALPVVVILWKVFVWDKAFGQWTSGRTDALSPELWNVVMAVIGFYFLYEASSRIARIFKR